MPEYNEAPFELIELETPAPDAIDGLCTGLSQLPKRINPKHFYDERGSALFDQITKLPEYYLTRTEIGILKSQRAEIAQAVGRGTCLIEYGSGSSEKVELLIDALEPKAYMPVDISAKHLLKSARRIHAKFQNLAVYAIATDFTRAFNLPDRTGVPRVAFFPGSSIGNFERTQAAEFLKEALSVIGPNGFFLLGVDARKSPQILNRAYNDSRGVTAEFNLNVLRHLNERYGADFILDAFAHEAHYLVEEGRVEMHLKSLRDQTATLDGHSFRFHKGERIHTENSYKYSREEIDELADRAGFETARLWTDENRHFFVVLLRPRNASALAE